jgi:hypothetical protein
MCIAVSEVRIRRAAAAVTAEAVPVTAVAVEATAGDKPFLGNEFDLPSARSGPLAPTGLFFPLYDTADNIYYVTLSI